MNSHLNKTLIKISQLFKKNGIPYMVIGGYAVSIYGEMRLTQDIDITLGVDVDNFDNIIKVISDDFIIVGEEPKEFANKTNVIIAVDKTNQIRVDIIFSFIPFETEAVNNAQKIKILNNEIKIVSVDDLLVYKLLAGRAKDIDDAKNIYSCNENSINPEKITNILRELSLYIDNNALENWNDIIKD